TARVREYAKRIEDEAFHLHPLRMVRSSRPPVRELLSIFELVRLYRRTRPDVVHHVALKPILYGSVAARLSRVPAVVNGFAGLGYIFTECGGRKGVLWWMVGKGRRWAVAFS